ncbi:phosphate ABC transporter permease subunit PstC [Candidatus Sumerlaeota bacterium]|nr:phosphate ABC transporter permease subunit PstC [Candidatus Sumerlaeota bacterium]
MGAGASRLQKTAALVGHGVLLTITSVSALAVLFIFVFIIRDALPFFRAEGFREFFTSTRWYPSSETAEFGALALFVGTALVTAGAVFLAAPLGLAAAVCLSDVLPFSLRQVVKPIIEVLAAIPSVAYGFFALVVLAPILQDQGGTLIAVCLWIVGLPLGAIGAVVIGDLTTAGLSERLRGRGRLFVTMLLLAACFTALFVLSGRLNHIEILSGTNALNVSLVLAIMALPTVVSVSEDALTAVGRELREGSYSLGATRAETVFKVAIPAASSGILAAVLLGVMRAIGETMVVWMASGNAAMVPRPWYNLLAPVRTLTATIAGDMGEADHVTGSSRYHVLFALGLCLLTFSFVCNLVSEWAVRRSKRARG